MADDVNKKMAYSAERIFVMPFFLDVRGRSCLLVGGEGEAIRKGLALLNAGASLIVVAERLAAELAVAVQEGRALWRNEPFVAAHLDGVWLAVSTCADETVNARIHAAAEERRVWLNVVDQPRYCTVTWPAVVEHPPVCVAISTGGAAPALAGYLRQRIGAVVPERIGLLARHMARWRQQVPGGLAVRAAFWRGMMDQGLVERFLSGDEAGAEAMVRTALQQADPPLLADRS
ncbi:MAG: bifunctional precorrin-2 dehydrogenase/sirohydrochlorin ferrochelatase [Magnetococcales bacterium]|nr:bifunctional precorrin-2 dehydrogenase/sirohydrochlorin ferrochelatase [Magnetococcales bacterium]